MKKLKINTNYVESKIIEQILEDNNIPVLKKASYGIGADYFGEGVLQDIYVNDNDYDRAIEIIEIYHKNNEFDIE